MRPGILIEYCEQEPIKHELDEPNCECKMENEFEFVVMPGEQEEVKQKNKQFIEEEFERLFNISQPEAVWRFTYVNNSHDLCNTYPTVLVTHRSITDEALQQVSSFRKKGRLPSPVWYCKDTGAALIRGSQPDIFTGLYGGAGAQTDEDNLRLLFSTSNKPPLIVDCRPQKNAFVNLFNHGGTETLLYEYEVEFANIPNVQGVAQGLNLLVEQDSTEVWLKNLHSIIKAAVGVAEKIRDGVSVFVHCSDGWDRTTQVTSLSQLLLDPYYRTIEGFFTLVEKEWVHFGHMFSLRTDDGKLECSSVEWAPIFAQWLNIVWWYMEKFPSAFEFGVALLERLLENTYNPKLYSGTRMPNLWEGISTACSRKSFSNSQYNQEAPFEWDSTPVERLWETLYFMFSRPHAERKIRQTVGLDECDNNFGDILSRLMRHLRQEGEGKEEIKEVPQQYAAYMNYLIEGNTLDREFWMNVAKEGRDTIVGREGLLHAHFEVTDSSAREGCRFQSYNLFKTRKDAETSLDVERKFIQERGLHEHLLLEATKIIPI